MNSLRLILSRLRYFAPAWVFASLNIMTGTWVLYIPHVKEKLAIDDGQLGIAMFCFALGTLITIPFTSTIIKKIGVGKATLIGIILFAIAYLFPLIVNDYYLLCFVLFITGIFSCFTDIAMNALVSDIEQIDHIHFMSASHGFFSLGGVIGAGIGSFLISFFNIPVIHMLYAALFVILSNLLIAKVYLKIRSEHVERKKSFFNYSLFKPLLGLTIISLIIMGSEGAIEHWSKLYLLDIVKVSSEEIAGLGFVVFSVMMMLGRFYGDTVSSKFGPLKIIIGGCILGILGYTLVLSSKEIYTLIGFGCIGLGFSVIIPELFRLAAKVKGVTSSEGISFVAGFGYIGFLSAPVVLGTLSDISSLRLSFIFLLIIAVIALFTSLILISKK